MIEVILFYRYHYSYMLHSVITVCFCILLCVCFALDERYIEFWKASQQDAHTVPSLWRPLLSYSEEDLCSLWLSSEAYAQM